MKQVIRPSTFETNSSSIHSLVFSTDEQEQLLKDGEAIIWGDEIVSLEEFKKQKLKELMHYVEVYGGVFKKQYMEVKDMTPKEIVEYYRRDGDIYRDWESWGGDLEIDEYTYEKDGFKINVTCKYGYN